LSPPGIAAGAQLLGVDRLTRKSPNEQVAKILKKPGDRPIGRAGTPDMPLVAEDGGGAGIIESDLPMTADTTQSRPPLRYKSRPHLAAFR
jgi:hypothetical protein